MPRIVSASERIRAIKLMIQKDANGNFAKSQRDIEYETGLSRPYIRKLSKEIGHQFPRNGIEIKGQVCTCLNCGCVFKKPPSRIKRAKNQFCTTDCKTTWYRNIR